MPDFTWFHRARFGMFIHWGPYAAAGRGEWVMNREMIPPQEYARRCVRRFTARCYDPRQWADLAKAAGMGYVVLTARHHDGFCLWNTRTTDWCASRMGPRRELIGPYVEAVRAAGLRVGLYYSVADWRHPDYPGAFQRDWPTAWTSPEARQRFVACYREQLRELMTGYGKIDMLWYDGCIPQPTDGASVNRMVRRLQPDILINERNGKPFDFRCSEQSLKAKEGPWESCMTLNGNWGYHAGDRQWKSPREVIRMLIATAGKGGNLLLNVGPRADGSLPAASVRILTQVGAWLARHRAWLPDSDRAPFSWNNCSMLTARGNSVYVHLFHLPGPGREHCLAEIANPVLSARWLATGQAVPFEQRGPRLFLRDLPWPPPSPSKDPVGVYTIELKVKSRPRPVKEQKTFWIPE